MNPNTQEKEYKVLKAITEGAITLREISKVTGLHPIYIKYFVEKLEEKGAIITKRKRNLWIIIPTAKAYQYLEMLQAQTVGNLEKG